MAEYEKKVREVLKRNGYVFHHHGRVIPSIDVIIKITKSLKLNLRELIE
jgi:hypothetical protein